MDGVLDSSQRRVDYPGFGRHLHPMLREFCLVAKAVLGLFQLGPNNCNGSKIAGRGRLQLTRWS
jgi:hypothetical protein